MAEIMAISGMAYQGILYLYMVLKYGLKYGPNVGTWYGSIIDQRMGLREA